MSRQPNKLGLVVGLLAALILSGAVSSEAQRRSGGPGAGYRGGTATLSAAPTTTLTQGRQGGGPGLRQQDRTRQRLRDGSCLSTPINPPQGRNQ